MSSKAIYEATGKDLINRHIASGTALVPCRFATFEQSTVWEDEIGKNPWLTKEQLVVKPDQLIKRRGKLGLVGVNKTAADVRRWIAEHMGKEQAVGAAVGKLRHFIVEPFVRHEPSEEMYLCIQSGRRSDTILFHHQGGVDVGDVDALAVRLEIPVDTFPTGEDVERALMKNIKSASVKRILTTFILALYRVYVDLYFTYMEINPIVITNERIYLLDLAAKLDQTADFICAKNWGDVTFPPPFGRDAYPEEAHIADLDAKSGASLKLTVLNKSGRIWTMVAGGGASVVYTDTICELGGAAELANYGEYSGAPTESQTADYAKTIFSLMCREKHPNGKVLIIGGGIANFTNVADTFRGIITAIETYKDALIQYNVTIFVRRGGPNYQEGLRQMREVGHRLRIPLYVFGPESNMTAIVGLALGHAPIPSDHQLDYAPKQLPKPQSCPKPKLEIPEFTPKLLNLVCSQSPTRLDLGQQVSTARPLFSDRTKAIIWGMQNRAIQGMLDFDYICRRAEPSVVAIVYPFTADHKQKYYFGNKEVFIPVFSDMDVAMRKHQEATVLVNFASLRSAYDSTMQAMQHPQINTIVIIAEGIPENMTRKIIKLADTRGVNIIGPATVGGIKPGCFKIGNTAGMIDNIIDSKLYRPGSVAYVSRSGGMSNELNNILSKNADGVCEGVAIGGDRYPGTTFIDHLLRFEADPNVKMLVLLGEVGGVEEYHVCRAMKEGLIKKPVVAWCIGTCSDMFTSEVQFGHAGSLAGSAVEKAIAKNAGLQAFGATVPNSFDTLGDAVKKVYKKLVAEGKIIEKEEVDPPKVPMDYEWARKLGLIRKPAAFISTICDERGQELSYCGVPISQILERQLGVGGVISLLWFQRELPEWACKFFELVLIVTADHGPAVSGAHNTMVTARAGKDLISSVVSGLLTIGDRFGGALDRAAADFCAAYDKGQHPQEFVNEKRAKGELIMGIGHRVKSINNPDSRVRELKAYVTSRWPAWPVTRYALDVEAITTRKKPNLILNVDGIVACAMVDLFRHCQLFTHVAYVSRSGGMSNELNNILSKNADGVCEGVAIGGDRYPGTTFIDHLLRFEADPNVKMLVLLGEVGGVEEYHVCRAMKEGLIKKPVVAWCIGTCSDMFTSEVQFGHAGSLAGSAVEKAIAKNAGLQAFGATVPNSFDTLGDAVKKVYKKLVAEGKIIEKEEVDPPKVPMDYEWARKLGLIRKPAAFISTICDERGQELSYCGVPISQILERQLGVGGVISLLWFQRELPEWACKFFELVLIVTADHGPAVSGAHNTMVTARAGKDLISSVVSGLLTIGDRFGGALDRAAADFCAAYDKGQHPQEFVNEKRAKGELIMGIGHRVKSINNPDSRVRELKAYVTSRWPAWPVTRYALDVEAITTRKKPNLILNVDGIVACAMVDLFRHCQLFTQEEGNNYIAMGSINALFVVGRSIGLVGHYLDQKRMKQPLYRHPWDDITYMSPIN